MTDITHVEVIEVSGKRFVRDKTDGLLEIKYGLPGEVSYCRRCVISNQRPSSTVEFKHTRDSAKQTIAFDADGICAACRVAEAKGGIDWAEREARLVELCDRFRSRNGAYDCLVPGSGGKDSVFASHLLKTKYGMNPLTVTWAPHMYTDVGWHNFQGWLHTGGFDNYLFTPNGEVHRTLTRLAVQNLCTPFQPFIFGQKNYAPKMAARFGIPLVFYGESEAEYGNATSEFTSAQRKHEYFAAHNLDNREMYFGGVPISELPRHGIEQKHLDPYLPINVDELVRQQIEIHYLGYYIRWTPQECYYYSVEHADFRANDQRTEGTYSKYNSLDDKIDGYHYYTTWIKFGIGRATYDAAQEIRNNHIDREEGVALVRRFDGELPTRYYKEFLDYVSMSDTEFRELCDGFRSPHLWRKSGSDWVLRHPIENL